MSSEPMLIYQLGSHINNYYVCEITEFTEGFHIAAPSDLPINPVILLQFYGLGI